MKMLGLTQVEELHSTVTIYIISTLKMYKKQIPQ